MTNTIANTLATQIQTLAPELIRWRRDFHKYAESGWTEMRTSSLIARHLANLGFQVLMGEQICDRNTRMGVPSNEVLDASYARAVAQGADPEFVEMTQGGMTGVIGILRCGEGPTVALRFDIDALGIQEASDCDHFPVANGFASVNPGIMHACGHDFHAACGMGVAQILAQHKDSLHGTLKLIFQPAEEGVYGAHSIVEKGHLDDVDFFLGAHNFPTDTQNSDLSPGTTGALATKKYNVQITGRSAHAGSNPHLGNNALLAAATAIVNLYAIPRHGQGATRVNVGKLIADTDRNIIADKAYFEMEVRGEDTALCDYMDHYALRILENAAAMHGCAVTWQLAGNARSVVCDPALTQRIADICTQQLDLQVSTNLLANFGASEDVSWMMDRVRSHGGQAGFMCIRSKQLQALHNDRYDLDEEYLSKSVRIFCAVACDLMK